MENRKLRAGMIGGGIGAFIGPVHRMALELDHSAEIVAGAFSRDSKKTEASGARLYLDPQRVYHDYRAMAEREAALPEDRRLDFVVIVTPNSTHFEIASTFLQHGFHVVCDKPVALTLEEAKSLQSIASENSRLFMITHAYTGYPMVKQARQMVRNGELGDILKVVVDYLQGWVPFRLQGAGKGEKGWKFDPKVSGKSLTIADIGIHAENLVHYITALEIEELCADTTSFLAGHGLEDDGSVLIRFRGGSKGVLSASQTLAGEHNGLVIRIYGTKKGLIWKQEQPEELLVRDLNRIDTVLHKGGPDLYEEANAAKRLPSGHPDGLIVAFANLYRAFYQSIRRQQGGEEPSGGIPSGDFPNIADGVRGMAFVETVLQSAASEKKWIKMKA
ncbi:MAG: Gfo/Idh/MocA family oxidoreductase [Spirochaetaceae bacterium]|nr:MAG: Gfo/Idh/MocA family oxidoreductase [Spirochaetaceae bacterium]